MFKKLDKKYVSETDKFLAALNERFGFKAESQQVEIKKHERVNKLRDNKDARDDLDLL